MDKIEVRVDKLVYNGQELCFSGIKNVQFHVCYYYMLLDRGLRVLQIKDDRLESVVEMDTRYGGYGDKIMLYQNIMFCAGDGYFELGDSVFLKIRHCHELDHLYQQKQCDDFEIELLNMTYVDSVFLENTPLVLLDEHGYKDKLLVAVQLYKNDYNEIENSINLSYTTRLKVFNGFVYAIGVNEKSYTDSWHYKKKAPNERELVCYILLFIGDNWLIIDELTSAPGEMMVYDNLNKVMITASLCTEGGWERYEFVLQKNVRCGLHTRILHKFTDISFVTYEYKQQHW